MGVVCGRVKDEKWKMEKRKMKIERLSWLKLMELRVSVASGGIGNQAPKGKRVHQEPYQLT